MASKDGQAGRGGRASSPATEDAPSRDNYDGLPRPMPRRRPVTAAAAARRIRRSTQWRAARAATRSLRNVRGLLRTAIIACSRADHCCTVDAQQPRPRAAASFLLCCARSHVNTAETAPPFAYDVQGWLRSEHLL